MIDCRVLTIDLSCSKVKQLLVELRAQSIFSTVEAVETIFVGSENVSNAEESCAAGHIKILKSFLASPGRSLLVLEDDVSLARSDFRELENLIELSSGNDEPSLHLLGGQEGIRSAFYFVGKRIQFPLPMWKEFYSKKYLFRTCCYLINRAAAKEYCLNNSSYNHRADDWSALLPDAEMYLVAQPFFEHPHDLLGSLIQGNRSTDRHIDGIKRLFLIFSRICCYFVKKMFIFFR